MTTKCDICAKSKVFGNNVSHSHRKTRRTWKPNLQTVRRTINGTPKRITVCASCYKAAKV
ncbi:MAG: 50S ribosomal protein L28 [Bifidobacteriaceae bacterium]|jgi:large subunit ribosomal protein L28|nr:50S ribosomal protein L28 [Bifidobacteriaceae bacterium]